MQSQSLTNGQMWVTWERDETDRVKITSPKITGMTLDNVSIYSDYIESCTLSYCSILYPKLVTACNLSYCGIYGVSIDIEKSTLEFSHVECVNLANTEGTSYYNSKITSDYVGLYSSEAFSTNINTEQLRSKASYFSQVDISGTVYYSSALDDLNSCHIVAQDFKCCKSALYDTTLINSSYVHITECNVAQISFKGCDLRGLVCSNTSTDNMNFSGCEVFSPSQWIKENCRFTESGSILVYKKIGDTDYPMPSYWVIEPGSFITEATNPSVMEPCACGVNVGTLQWIVENYGYAGIWECEIIPEDFFGVVIPIQTNGKFRANRVKLVRLLSYCDIEEISYCDVEEIL